LSSVGFAPKPSCVPGFYQSRIGSGYLEKAADAGVVHPGEKIPGQFLRAKHAERGGIEVKFLFGLRTGVASAGPSVPPFSARSLTDPSANRSFRGEESKTHGYSSDPDASGNDYQA
jgi:hypothetical protein